MASASGEDIVLCVDVDEQVQSDMKLLGYNGQPLTRLDAVKQALLLFVHSKLRMGLHRCAIATMAQVASWHLHPFTSDLDVITQAVRSLSAQGRFDRCDVSSLVSMLNQNPVQQGRCLRVILVYCRSRVVPTASSLLGSSWPITLDVLYLHDKPAPSNCPQRVYDALVDIVERHDLQEHAGRGYIYETSSPLARVYFKLVSLLISHPQQRCAQEDLDAPRDLLPPSPSSSVETIP